MKWIKESALMVLVAAGATTALAGHHEKGEGVMLAVDTKSGTKKFRMTFSDLEDNFTLSIDGLSYRQMPRYEEAIDEGKIVFCPCFQCLIRLFDLHLDSENQNVEPVDVTCDFEGGLSLIETKIIRRKEKHVWYFNEKLAREVVEKMGD